VSQSAKVNASRRDSALTQKPISRGRPGVLLGMSPITISKRAYRERVIRAILADGHTLVASRTKADKKAFGAYFVVDTKTGEILERHTSVEKQGQKLAVLKTWEVLAKD
jgi:hypothetical protein